MYYYRLDIINTPVGTGVDKIYVQYTYENGVDNGQLASTDGHTGFIATVPMNLTMTDIKIVPKSAESSIIVDGYSDGSTPGAVVLKNVPLPDNTTIINFIVKSVNNIENPYTLRILKLDEADYGMLVKVQSTIDANWDDDRRNVYSRKRTSDIPDRVKRNSYIHKC